MFNRSTSRITSLPDVTNLVPLAAALALGVVAWQHIFHAYGLAAMNESLAGHLMHILRDAMLALPVALLALTGALTLTRRLGIGQSGWRGLLGSAAAVSIAWMLLAMPGAGLQNLSQQLPDAGIAAAQADTPAGEQVSIAVQGQGSDWLEGPQSLIGLVRHGIRDVLVGQVVTLPLALLLLLLLARREGRLPTLVLPRGGGRRTRRALKVAVVSASVLLVLLLPGTGQKGSVKVAQAQGSACSGPERIYNVSAIHITMTLNRFGDHDPTAYMYALDENLNAVAQQMFSGQVSSGLRKDPIQPLVIRANLGDCLVINFTNRLTDGDASLHVHGLPYTIDNAGSAVGNNPNSFAAAGQTITYRVPIPTDPAAEHAYYLHDHGASRQRVSHGLFGTVVAEPAGSVYRDPETGDPLELTTNGSNWEAVIDVPGGPAFREFVLIYHEVGNESFKGILDANGNNLPQVDDVAGTYRPASRAINYRSEPFRNRFLLNFDKSQGYSSYMFGDPATPIPRSYLGEPTKTRLMHGGSEVFHVHHLHGGGDRWRRNPKADPNNDISSGLVKQPAKDVFSTHLDSQSIGPGTSYNLEHECGAGGCQQSAGDFLFHCHIGQHYVSGMWSFWRVFDTQQPDLAPLPDRGPAPGAVNSIGLIGQTFEGKTLVPANQLTDPNTQRALEDWIESQLPPQGVRLDGEDATVWDWIKEDTPNGPLYKGEPETTEVWANYASSTPGQRPDIMFNPTNGRYAWPLLRPHLKRPPFSPNGHSGAPWLGERGSALRPDGLCPNQEVVNNPGQVIRKYPITAITLPIQVTDDQIDPNGMIFSLNEEKEAIRNGLKPAQPLAIRSNVGDCADIILTSELPDAPDNNFHSKVNMHTHFVQFDPQASDGVITGFSFEQSIRPYESEGRILEQNASAGDADIVVTHVNRLRPGIWLGVGLGEGMCPAPGGGADVPCTEVRRILSIAGNIVTLDQPLDLDHPAGQAVGVEFVRYAWYSDVDTGTVFYHDHVNFKRWDHGLFGSHIVEPAGSTYHDPVTGAEVRSGTIVDIHAPPDASVGWGQSGSFREFMLFLHNNSPVTTGGGVEGAGSGGTINLRAEPLHLRGDINDNNIGIQHTLAEPAAAGQSTITLNTAMFVQPGLALRIGVVPKLELRKVIAVNGTTVTLDQPLAFNHVAGEPVDGDHSVLFSSVTYDDPITPLPRAYVGDPFVIRALGLVERVGGLRVAGHRFRIERFAGEGVLYDSTALGISERFDLVMDGGAGGPAGMPGDYLYYSTVARDFKAGAWGIIRVHDTLQPNLQPLPDRTLPPNAPGFPQQTFTGGNPQPAADPGQPCPSGAAVRSYELSIFRKSIPFSGGLGGTDLNGIVYALAEDESAILGGTMPVEPLVIRVNAGECLELALTNHLAEQASLSLGKLLFDPQGSGGAAVGFNPDSTVGPTGRRVYRFYADVELGTSLMLNLASPKQVARGAYGAVIVEPAGSEYRNPHTGKPLRSGIEALVVGPKENFREYALLFQDEDPRIGQTTMPYPTEVQGFSGINYHAIPLKDRLAVNPDRSKVFDSTVHGDPATMIDAYTGDPMRYRVAQPWGEQVHVFSMEGHRWLLEPNMPGSEEMFSRILAPGNAFDAVIVGENGSQGLSTTGDYLYLDHRQPFTEAGLWGVMRVFDTPHPEIVQMGANLAITAGDSPNPVAVGQPLTYTLTVTNTGPFDASGVVVTDTLPPGVTFVSATSNPPAACSEAGGIITCNFGALANGAQATVTIIGTPGTAGLKTNTAGVAGNENDLFTANNSATTSTITPGPGCYDVNASGGVDIADIALVAAAWRATDAISLALYDFNSSGRVDIADILAAAAHWGESCL